MRTDGEPSARVGRVGFKRARGAWSCRGIHYGCFVVYEPTSVGCIATPGPHPTLTDESTLVAHHENPKDTHPEKDINFPLICAHDPRIRVDTPPRAPPARSRPHTSTRRQGIIMFTVRASSVQATRHVALNRPARAQRAVAMRAGKVRRSRSLARRRRRGSRSREPFDEVPRSPDRGLSVARCAREVARGWGARGTRGRVLCARVSRAREDGARGTATRGDEGRDRAVSISSALRWALCVWRLTCGIDTVCPYEL